MNNKQSSIKTKLNITLISVILIMFFMITVPVFIFYQPYYESQQKDFLTSAYSKLNKYPANEAELTSNLLKISGSEYMNMFVLDESQDVVYATNRQIETNNNEQQLFNMDLSKTNLKTNNNSFIILSDINPTSNIKTLFLATHINIGDIGYYVIFEKPIGDIHSVVNSIVLFIFICIIPMSLFSILIVTRVSNFIISPILELSKISNEIANFNFDVPITTKTNDEIGILSSNIEKLAIELKGKIEELEAQNNILKTAIIEKDRNAKIQKDFISNVSHELKTPITLILGYCEALKLDVDEETKNEYMGIIISESHKMNNLISDMLDIARLQSGDKQLTKEPFDFSALLHKLINKHQLIFKENKINLTTDIEDNIIINGDKSKLELVLSNFVVNAVRYVDEKKNIKISLFEEDNKYIFKIYNTANAFSDEDIKKIWGSFYKIDKAHSREKGGTGIGLYLVKTILELHDFEYGVSNVQDGVEFFIKIPKNIK